MSGPAATVGEEELRHGMDRAVARHVPALLGALALVAAVSALFVDAGHGTRAGRLVLAADWAMAATFGAGALWTWRRGVPEGMAHPIILVVAAVWTVYAAYSLGAFGETLDIAILVFVALGAGLFLLLPRWQIAMLAIAAGGFVVPALTGAVQETASAGVFLLAALALGAISGRHRHQLHVSLAEANERIRRHGEERVRRLTDRLDEVVWILSADRSELRYVNPAFEAVYGRSPEALLGDEDGFLERVHPDDREALRDAFDPEGADPFEVEFRYERPDGETRHIVTHGQPIRGPDGEIVEWAGIARDVTEMRRHVHALERANQELARSRREIESYLHVASHELQQPIRDVTRFASLLLEDDDHLGVDREDAGRYVRQAAVRLHRRLEGFLDYLEDELRPLATETVDAGEALARAMARLRETNGLVEAEVARGEMPALRADPDLLTEIFYQLLDNACRYDDDPPTQIDVRAERRDEEWVFTVRDDGIGIPDDRIDRLFQPFQQLETPDHSEGSGLGLAIVRRAIERHGGRVWAEDDPEGGALFGFTIPVATGRVPGAESRPDRRDAEPPAS